MLGRFYCPNLSCIYTWYMNLSRAESSMPKEFFLICPKCAISTLSIKTRPAIDRKPRSTIDAQADYGSFGSRYQRFLLFKGDKFSIIQERSMEPQVLHEHPTPRSIAFVRNNHLQPDSCAALKNQLDPFTGITTKINHHRVEVIKKKDSSDL